MPRYYLHLCRGDEKLEDVEGSEFADIEAARKEAIASARSILSDEIRHGLLPLDEWIEIADGAGKTLMSVYFLQAIQLRMSNSTPATP